MRVDCLFDESSVSEHHGVRFALNPATKHPANPVLMPGQAHEWDSLQVSWPGTVLYSAHDRKFRAWYAGLDVVQHADRCWMYGYAESDDGVRWVKPKLDQATFLDRPTNQLKPNWFTWPAGRKVPTWGTYMLSCVFENPLFPGDAPPAQRFGSYWLETLIEADGRTRFVKSLAWSPDGIAWTRACTAYEPLPYSRPNFHDIYQVVFDPEEPDPAYRVKAYSQIPFTRAYDGRKEVRHVGLLHGKRFDHLVAAADPIALAPEEGIDEEIHFITVKKIGNTFVMIFESDRFSQSPGRGDLRLAVSADGRKFHRVHPRTPLVATGARGMWDENLLVLSSSAMQEVGDEIFIYYFGCSGVSNSWPAQYETIPGRRGALFYPVSLGLATLPRDRFAFAAGEGSVTSHPLELNADGDLWLNAEGDDISVTALDSSDNPIARGTLGAERRQTVYRKVVWADGKAPREMRRAQIHLAAEAKLFSLAY